MNCREFRRQHDEYVDDTLSGVGVEAMTRHLRGCAECARSDTRVRRALLLAHNLPRIEPSAAFGDRLQLRLRHERAIMAGHGGRRGTTEGRWRPAALGMYAALAAAMLLAAGLGTTLASTFVRHEPIRLAPVVATLSESEPAALATSAMVASMPAGISLWPAVFVAQQAPWHFASDAVGR